MEQTFSCKEPITPTPAMATQDDFAAAKYHAPVAVYCGSVPKFKARYTALRGRSVDSNTWFCDSSWMTEEEASLQSTDAWVSQAAVHSVGTGDGGDLSHLSHQALTQDPREREVSSVSIETIRINDKLKKRRMSEGLLPSLKGLADCSDVSGVTLQSAASGPASQRPLITPKPVPPIQNSLPASEPSGMSNGEQEREENGTGRGDSDGNNKELMSEDKGHQASLLPLYCGGGNGKKSLGVPLIPPIVKSARPSDEAPGSSAVHLSSSQHQEALEMRPRSGNSSEEKTLESQELRTLEPVLPVLQHHLVDAVKSAGHLHEPVPPLAVLPLNQAKEMDLLMSPHLLSDDDLRDSNGRIHVTLSKSAQKKIQQKRMRDMELLRLEREKEREKEKSLELPTQSVDPGVSAKESFGLPPINGMVSLSASTSNACRESAGTALRKRDSRFSLPSIHVSIEGGSFPRNSSANSLPAISLDFLEWGEEPESGAAWEARPFPHPQQELLNALTWLKSDDWEQKAKGLFSIRCLAVCRSEVLLCRLPDVSRAVTQEVNNLRSKVSRFAINTLGELFRTMKKNMDHEVDEIARVLLQKMGDSSEFIQKAASRSLGIMVRNVTPARAMTALMATGAQHRNALVRKCTAEHLLTLMEQIGAKKLLSGTRGSTEVLVHALVKLAQDCHQDTRSYGRKMLNILMSHRKFDSYLKQTVPSRDLQDVMARIKQKGIEDHKCEPSSAKDLSKSRNSSLVMAQDNLPSDEGLRPDDLILPCQTVRRTSLRTVEQTEQLNELYKLLTAKEFRARMEGVVVLLDHCKSSPQLISTNVVQIFDVFILRLQDSHKKVKQQALEALALMTPLLRDALHPVLVPLVEAVTDNLNSKHLGISAAALKALETLTAHLDNTLLLQAFAHRVRYLSGQALLDVTEQLSVLVVSVYPRKPQAVKRYALPVLWFFLGKSVLPIRSGNVRAAIAKLAQSLYQVMGSSLKEHAARQPPHVGKNLCEILDLKVK